MSYSECKYVYAAILGESKADFVYNRYYTTLRFPILDSYPRDLLPRSNGETAVEIHAALSTTTRIGDKLKELQTIAGRTIGVDEREALINGLGELRESYEKGWISDTDDDY